MTPLPWKILINFSKLLKISKNLKQRLSRILSVRILDFHFFSRIDRLLHVLNFTTSSCQISMFWLELLVKKESNQKQPSEVFYKKRCFPVNFVKFLRTPFSQSNSGRLLLSKLRRMQTRIIPWFTFVIYAIFKCKLSKCDF